MPKDIPVFEKDVIADYADDLHLQLIEKNKLAVKRARIALFLAAALLFIGEMIPMLKHDDPFDLTVIVIAVLISALFVILGLWTKKKPYTAILTGLIAFVAYIILVVVVSGMAEGTPGIVNGLLTGIFIKVIVLINLIAPLKQARELQEANRIRY